MRAVEFPGANIEFGKPASMTDEQCASVPGFIGEDETGVRYALTAWLPSYEDLQAMNAGRPVMLQIAGGMAPVSLWTYDEELQPNV